MLSKNRLLLNQTSCTRDEQGVVHINTRHTYESVNAIYDINIIDGATLYAKNCTQILVIQPSDQKYYDFIKVNIS